MDCVGCGSTAVTERPDLTVQGYHRFRCRDCGKQFNERSDGVLNRASLPSDVIAFVVFCQDIEPRSFSRRTNSASRGSLLANLFGFPPITPVEESPNDPRTVSRCLAAVWRSSISKITLTSPYYYPRFIIWKASQSVRSSLRPTPIQCRRSSDRVRDRPASCHHPSLPP